MTARDGSATAGTAAGDDSTAAGDDGAASGTAADAAPIRRRIDAERNRRRLLTVARAALEDSGETSMQAIAKAAGVGQGTLYRHFPTREALLLEVYAADFERLIDAAGTLLREHRPAKALRLWLDELSVFGRKKHALADVLDSATRADLHTAQYDRIIAAIAAILDAGQAAGELREDIRPDELLPLVSFLWQLDTRHDPRISHLLDLVTDGILAKARRAAR
jgi:AcrR family transcriptional regulator